jgi:hypothetical protein
MVMSDMGRCCYWKVNKEEKHLCATCGQKGLVCCVPQSCYRLIIFINNSIIFVIFIFFARFSSKRTVDFGLSRGYSGAQEAKHRMAMQIANFAGGPGRRKRLSPGKFATQV